MTIKMRFFLTFLAILIIFIVFDFVILPIILLAYEMLRPCRVEPRFRLPKHKDMTMAKKMNAKSSKTKEKTFKRTIKIIKREIRAYARRGECMLSLDYDLYRFYFCDKETFLRVGKYFEKEGFYVQYNKDEYEYPSKIWISWRDGDLK